MAEEKSHILSCRRSTIRMIVSSTHGSGARGCVTACVGTADVPAASGTSDRAAVPSRVSSGIYKVLEMRDGDKSKLRDKGILKAEINIIDIIAHRLLDMDVWEQPEIDKLLVETLDGSKYERYWSRANFSANATLAISTTVCRAGAAKSEVRLYTYISKLTGKPTDMFMMPVLCFNVISGGSRAGSCLAFPEFFIVPTGAGNAAEDMTTDTEVYHTLEFGYPEDVRRGACKVGDETGFAPIVQLNNETLDFITDSFELDQGVLPRCE